MQHANPKAEARQNAVEMIRSGANVYEVLSVSGYSLTYLRKLCRDAGVVLTVEREPRKPRRHQINPKSRMIVLEFLKGKKTYEEIGKLFGVTRQSVHDTVSRHKERIEEEIKVNAINHNDQRKKKTAPDDQERASKSEDVGGPVVE